MEPIAEKTRTILKNQTKQAMDINLGDEVLRVPPLGEIRFAAGEFEEKYDSGQREIIQKEKGLVLEERTRSPALTISIALAFWCLVIGLPLGLINDRLKESELYWGLFIFVLLGLPFAGWAFSSDKARRQNTGRVIVQYVSLTIAVVFCVGLPGLCIYYFGGGQDLLTGDTAYGMEFLARISQLLFVSIASLIPALLFYLYQRQRMSTEREEFYRHVMLLDDSFQTVEDVKARYNRRIEEVYGPEEGGGGRLLHGTRVPIIIATLMMVLGWILTLPIIGAPPPVQNTLELHQYFTPTASPLSFAFLGAYFFAINMIFRRYVRADLRPKAYSHVAIRILVALILVWFLQVMLGEQADKSGGKLGLYALAFVVGVFPETWLTVVQEYGRSTGLFFKKVFLRLDELREAQPLTRLEGINLYHRARLLEEGIENIENLAHHDLVDLILKTRIPVPTIIDWMDQAILYLHGQGHIAGTDETHLDRLRVYGIRTASDMQRVYERAEQRDKKGTGGAAGNVEEFLGILPSLDGAQTSPVRTILDALEDDEWLMSIRQWRSQNRLV